MSTEAARPLSALLSQVLVAFTVELDNEFERRMLQAGEPGTISMGVWANLMRFLSAGPVSIRDLAARALASEKQTKFELGCLERWRLVKLEPDPADDRPIPTTTHRLSGRVLRDGWGSGRGMRSDWMVRLTRRGQKACEIWPPLFDEIERRWMTRFGDDYVSGLRRALEDVAAQLDFEMPQALPGYWEGEGTYPPRIAHAPGSLSLPALLSQVLLAFTIEFERESRAPLWLCANTLRVLGEKPIRESDIPRLTGGSPETSGIGWQIKPYIVIEPDPAAKRGKVVRLSPRGLAAQQAYRDLNAAIEKRWEANFGKARIARLRDSLRELFVPRSGDRLLLSEGLVPAEGTVRSGAETPALGRREVATAARQRMRDLVAQTEQFVRDPAGTLPHYPLWDMNRGFGP